MDNFEDFMKGMENFLGIMEKINEAAKTSVFDSISSPIAQFELVTGKDPMEGGYATLCNVVKKHGSEEEKKIACISIYDTYEEAMDGHNEWRRMIITNPPAILKDIKRDEIIYV